MTSYRVWEWWIALAIGIGPSIGISPASAQNCAHASQNAFAATNSSTTCSSSAAGSTLADATIDGTTLLVEQSALTLQATASSTQAAVQQFLSRRADLMTSMSPDSGRVHGRLGAPSIGSAPMMLGAPPVGAIGTEVDRETTGSSRFSFASSLSQMRQNGGSSQFSSDERSVAPMRLSAASKGHEEPLKFDIWAQGTIARYDDDRIGKREGHAGVLFVGADYVLHPSVLVGVLVQMDQSRDELPSSASIRGGQGWMAGPYISARLSDHIFFDARAAWGKSSSHIDPLGSYTDTFSTDRGLISGKLTGRWSFGAWRFRPGVEATYFQESQWRYTNQLGIDIPGQTVSLGRAIFGPEVGYQFNLRHRSMVEPYVGLKGIWDFSSGDRLPAAGLLTVGGGPLRAKVEAGATLTISSSFSFRGSLSYDGIGDDNFRAVQGGVFAIVPLN